MDRECANSYCAEYREKSGKNIKKRMILLRRMKSHNATKCESPFSKGHENAGNALFSRVYGT